ncbi:hypothetical protein [Halobacteriovorax sp. DPLXC-1]|uniref:hypothetical protein n=1 Tax=Halobacteriovorax sp. DPLXC-1 TaxID=3110771 RepID=UPI002FEF735B
MIVNLDLKIFKIICICIYLIPHNSQARSLLSFGKKSNIKIINRCNSVEGSLVRGYQPIDESCIVQFNYEKRLSNKFKDTPNELINFYILYFVQFSKIDKLKSLLDIKKDFVTDRFTLALASTYGNKEILDYLKNQDNRYSEFAYRFFKGNHEQKYETTVIEDYSFDQLKTLFKIKYGDLGPQVSRFGEKINNNLVMIEQYQNDILFIISNFGYHEKAIFLLKEFECNCSLLSYSTDFLSILKSNKVDLAFKENKNSPTLISFIIGENLRMARELLGEDYSSIIYEIDYTGSSILERKILNHTPLEILKKAINKSSFKFANIIVNKKGLKVVDLLWKTGRVHDVYRLTDGEYEITDSNVQMNKEQALKVIKDIRYRKLFKQDDFSRENLQSTFTRISFYNYIFYIFDNNHEQRMRLKFYDELRTQFNKYHKRFYSYIEKSDFHQIKKGRLERIPLKAVNFAKVNNRSIIEDRNLFNHLKNVQFKYDESKIIQSNISPRKFACISLDYELYGVFDSYIIEHAPQPEPPPWGEESTTIDARLDYYAYTTLDESIESPDKKCDAVLEMSENVFKYPFDSYEFSIDWRSVLPENNEEHEFLAKNGISVINQLNDKYSLVTDYINYYVSDSEGNLLKIANFECDNSSYDGEFYCSTPSIAFIGDLNGDGTVDVIMKDGKMSQMTVVTLEFYISQKDGSYKFHYISWPTC